MFTRFAAAGQASPHVRPRYLTPSSSTSTTPTPAPLAAIGFFGVVRAVRSSARLTSTERLVLLTIASHADNRTGEAFPGMPRLAAECGFTVRTIERTVAALDAAGWLARDSAASPWGTNVYRVTPRPDDVRPPSPRHPRSTPDTRSGTPRSSMHATPDTRSGNLPSEDLPLEIPMCERSAPHPSPTPSTHPEIDRFEHEHSVDAEVTELHEHEHQVDTRTATRTAAPSVDRR